MRRGVSVPNFGAYGDPAALVDLAVRAEDAGWDGFFVWDHVAPFDGVPVADPWAVLGAIAVRTDRVAIGPMVTPLPRRRPWIVARQSTTVDHLSDGRLVLGVGLGSPDAEEFGRFGEATDARHRAEKLDEALAIITRMWAGDAFEHRGLHYTVESSTFGPRPVGSTIPIWVGGVWPTRRPLERAARHHGAFPVRMDGSPWTPEDTAQLARIVDEARGGLDDFDIVASGTPADLERDGPAHAEAGATWFVASPEMGQSPDDLIAAICG